MTVNNSRLFCQFLAASLSLIFGGNAVSAQNLNFVVQNNLSPEEIYISTQQGGGIASVNSNTATRAALSISGNAVNSQGSATYALQSGSNNFSGGYINESPGAITAATQFGQGNSTVALIDDSPKSVIAQFQSGSNLSSDVFIVGGQGNEIATAQIGNSLGITFGLIDSTDTTVVYGQAGNNYSGGIVIRNAPAGTVIRLK